MARRPYVCEAHTHTHAHWGCTNRRACFVGQAGPRLTGRRAEVRCPFEVAGRDARPLRGPTEVPSHEVPVHCAARVPAPGPCAGTGPGARAGPRRSKTVEAAQAARAINHDSTKINCYRPLAERHA